MTTAPVIIDELRDLIDLPSEREQKELEKSILADGIRDPIVVWKEQNAIVDGHNRYKVALAHNLPFKTTEMSFKNMQDAKDWMIRNQLSRRNLSPARFDYFIGVLYNERKQDPTKGRTKQEKTTAEIIGEEHGISERSVRRLGDQAKGLDVLEEVKGKLAKMRQLEGKGDMTKEELGEVGKIATKNIDQAKKVVTELDKIKAEQKKASAKVRSTKDVVKQKEANNERYAVAFVQPDFHRLGYSVQTEPKPPLLENSVVYMSVADEDLFLAFKLLDKWGCVYQGTFNFAIDGYEGSWSDVRHHTLIAATKGTVAGPKAKDAAHSIHAAKGNVQELMTKLVEKYHPSGKKIDMRKNPAKGWDMLTK